LISSGWLEPFGLSNSSAGPPALTVRSTISVTSRCGSTSAETRTSSFSRSSSAIQARRSVGLGMTTSLRLQCVFDRIGEGDVLPFDPAAFEPFALPLDHASSVDVPLRLPLSDPPAALFGLDSTPEQTGFRNSSLGGCRRGESSEEVDDQLPVLDRRGDPERVSPVCLGLGPSSK